MDDLKLMLFAYNAFYNAEVQQDSFECLILLTNIINKGLVPCSVDEHMATFYRDSLSERLFTLVLEKYVVRDKCGLRHHSFETTTVSYITPTSNAFMQRLVLQDHKQNFTRLVPVPKKALGM